MASLPPTNTHVRRSNTSRLGLEFLDQMVSPARPLVSQLPARWRRKRIMAAIPSYENCRRSRKAYQDLVSRCYTPRLYVFGGEAVDGSIKNFQWGFMYRLSAACGTKICLAWPLEKNILQLGIKLKSGCASKI